MAGTAAPAQGKMRDAIGGGQRSFWRFEDRTVHEAMKEV